MTGQPMASGTSYASGVGVGTYRHGAGDNVPVGGGCCGETAMAGDCAGACGGMETACCEATRSVRNKGWAYVGEGMGAYAISPQYNYVGEGAGSYEKQQNTTYYGWRFRKCCI